jgi:hypothetical protein
LLIPSLNRNMTEDFNGKSSMEAARLADRQEGSAESKPLVQTSVSAALSTTDVNKLKQLAKGNTPTGVMSVKLQRPIAAIRSKAQREGISLRPINRSPYNRRAKAAKRV